MIQASTATVTLTASVTTKGSATITPKNTSQTIASGTYLKGIQTFEAVTTSNLTAANIANGVTIKVGTASDDDSVASVTGSLSFINVYTGSGTPSSSLEVMVIIYSKLRGISKWQQLDLFLAYMQYRLFHI